MKNEVKILRIHKEMAIENPAIRWKMHLKMTKIKVFTPQNSQFLILYDYKLDFQALRQFLVQMHLAQWFTGHWW